MEEYFEEFNKLVKNRGFYWLSYEIYGGAAGFYDFGPLGIMLKSNIMELWRRMFIHDQRGLVIEIETPIITPRIVLKASGHEDNFTDPITECRKCGRLYRVDHLLEETIGAKAEGLSMEQLWKIIKENNVRCPEDGGELTPPKPALLLFKTEIGPYKGSQAYIRPETAQGIFVSFKNIISVVRDRLPIGIAQIGKVGRNEISPRQGLIRLREFTIMEIEFFFDPLKAWDEASKHLTEDLLNEELNILSAEMKEKGVEEHVTATLKEFLDQGLIVNPWLGYWMAIGNRFLKRMCIPPDKIRFEEKLPHERAHYAQQTFDQEVYTKRFGWVEVAGFAYRTDYDLSQHIKYSKADLTMFRKYEKPLEKRVVRAIPNIPRLKEAYGRKVGEILKALNKLSNEGIIEKLERDGYIRIGEYKLDKQYFTIKEEKIKIFGEKFVPHVVEPSYGLERLFYVVLEFSFHHLADGRNVLKIPVELAPYKAAVFPLVTGSSSEHKRIKELAIKIYNALVDAGVKVLYDESGSIGRRYVRADEMGVPYAITVDYQSIEDHTITIRFRDTREQERVHLKELYERIMELLGKKVDWKIILRKYDL